MGTIWKGDACKHFSHQRKNVFFVLLHCENFSHFWENNHFCSVYAHSWFPLCLPLWFFQGSLLQSLPAVITTERKLIGFSKQHPSFQNWNLSDSGGQYFLLLPHSRRFCCVFPKPSFSGGPEQSLWSVKPWQDAAKMPDAVQRGATVPLSDNHVWVRRYEQPCSVPSGQIVWLIVCLL